MKKSTYRALRYYLSIPPLLLLIVLVIDTGDRLYVWISLNYVILAPATDYLIRKLVKFEGE